MLRIVQKPESLFENEFKTNFSLTLEEFLNPQLGVVHSAISMPNDIFLYYVEIINEWHLHIYISFFLFLHISR